MKLLLLMLCLLAAATATVRADECYRREYGADHLRANPDQTIRLLEMRFYADGDFVASVRAGFAGDPAIYGAEMTCANPPWVEEGVILCDGTGAVLARGYGSEALTIFTHGGFDVATPGGASRRPVIDRGAVDTLFRLARVEPESCG